MNTNSNIYHRYLNLPFEYPKPERFNFPLDTFNLPMDVNQIYNPFKLWVESVGLTISNVLEGFYTAPNGGRVPLHTDSAQTPGINDICKLNFTWGSSDSTTRWYKIKDESKLKQYTHGKEGANSGFYNLGVVPDMDISQSLIADWEDVDLVYEAVINRPSLINISQLHSTWNPSPTEHRWTLCCVLLDDGKQLTFQKAIDIFKNYIEE